MAKDPQARWGFGADEISKESHTFIESVREMVTRETCVMGVRASRKSDFFWYAQEAAQEDGKPEEQCYMGTRVRLRNGTLSLDWYRNKFSTVTAQKGRQKKVFSTHIRKSTKQGHGNELLKGQPAWAVDIIGEVEKEYQRIRKQTEVLGKMKRLLRDYEALLKAD